jgi:hypothetical protein
MVRNYASIDINFYLNIQMQKTSVDNFKYRLLYEAANPYDDLER